MSLTGRILTTLRVIWLVQIFVWSTVVGLAWGRPDLEQNLDRKRASRRFASQGLGANAEASPPTLVRLVLRGY